MSKCRADPACPYPPMLGEDVCREHYCDGQVPFTLHENSNNGQVRPYEEIFYKAHASAAGMTVHARGVKKLKGGTERRGRPKMTDEEKKRRAESYCRAYLPNGVRCNARIDARELYCEACKERLLPTKKPPTEAGGCEAK
jgi:hypothetical protein